MNDKIRYFFPKVFNRLSSEKNRIWKYLPTDKISVWGMGRIPSKEEFCLRLNLILGEFSPGLFNSVYPKERANILESAEQAINHNFDLLGSGIKHLDPIPWHSDFKFGYTWPQNIFYRGMRGMAPVGADIKVPWELSRCQHLLWLGEAYVFTNDEKYAKEIVDEINDWIENNPLMYSINWTCAMDVAIRAVNWLYALALIKQSNAFSNEFTNKVYKSLFQHLFFINNNLEKSIPQSNNHYFSDIVGQLYLGQLFSTTLKGKRTLSKAIKEYKKEILTQFFPSGVNYEKSVSYHRLMTELVVYPYYMLLRTGHKMPAAISERVSRMLGYVNQYTMADGSAPMISDNDDGRLLPFVPAPFMKHAYLVDCNSLDSRIASIGCEWVSPAYDAEKSSLHTDANLAILKNNGLYLYASCFDRWRRDKLTNSFAGTHLHNDSLSFVFADGITPIIVDAGAYCYTSNYDEWKNFRSAKKHNTIVVDDEEPNILGKSVFVMKYNTTAKPMSMSSGDYEHCEGEYTTITGQMTHRRSFDLKSNSLTITDNVEKSGECHNAYMSFHFAEGIEPTIEEGVIHLNAKDKQYRMTIEGTVPPVFRIVDDSISPSFGVLASTKTIVAEVTFSQRMELTTNIERI